MRQAHCQRIIAARCTADTDTQPRTDTDEHRTDERRDPRQIDQTRIHIRRQDQSDPFKQRVKQRKSGAGDHRIYNEPPPEHPPSEQIAQRIHHKGSDRRRDAEMMPKQQCRSEHTALGHARKRMYMEKSERLDRASQHQDRHRHGMHPQHAANAVPINRDHQKSSYRDPHRPHQDNTFRGRQAHGAATCRA